MTLRIQKFILCVMISHIIFFRDKGEEEAEKTNKRILKKMNTLERQLNILFYTVLISRKYT